MSKKKPNILHTLLLSSMSALFPTSILFTLSEACCSILRIQFLISGKIQDSEFPVQMCKELKITSAKPVSAKVLAIYLKFFKEIQLKV